MTGARGDAIYPRIYARVRWGCEARRAGCGAQGCGGMCRGRESGEGQGVRGVGGAGMTGVRGGMRYILGYMRGYAGGVRGAARRVRGAEARGDVQGQGERGPGRGVA